MSSYWTFQGITLCEEHALSSTKAGIAKSVSGSTLFPEPPESMVEAVLIMETFAAMAGKDIPEELRFTHSESGDCPACEEEALVREIRALIFGEAS